MVYWRIHHERVEHSSVPSEGFGQCYRRRRRPGCPAKLRSPRGPPALWPRAIGRCESTWLEGEGQVRAVLRGSRVGTARGGTSAALATKYMVRDLRRPDRVVFSLLMTQHGQARHMLAQLMLDELLDARRESDARGYHRSLASTQETSCPPLSARPIKALPKQRELVRGQIPDHSIIPLVGKSSG